MTLQEFIESLSTEQQFDLALNFCERTLGPWNKFAAASELEFTNEETGAKHRLPANLLNNAFACIRSQVEADRLNQEEISQWQEKLRLPILALQDGDWEPYKAIEMSFYAVKNFLDRLGGETLTIFNEPQIMVVVNQAIEALVHAKAITEQEIGAIFEQYAS